MDPQHLGERLEQISPRIVRECGGSLSVPGALIERPTTGKIAAKVINDDGDEVMEVFAV